MMILIPQKIQISPFNPILQNRQYDYLASCGDPESISSNVFVMVREMVEHQLPERTLFAVSQDIYIFSDSTTLTAKTIALLKDRPRRRHSY
jgi:hypothetical protein